MNTETLASTPFGLLVADDQEVVRMGVRALIESQPGWKVCAQAANGRDAVTLAKRTLPDVAVIDISMPELNGLETTRQIRAAVPSCEVAILTCNDSEFVAREALLAGARAFILKNDAAALLVEAIKALRERAVFLTPRIEALVLAGYLENQREPAAAAPPVLSPREREVLQLVAEGKDNRQVGAVLGVSVRTVETYRTNLMYKLGLHGLSDLIHYAIRNGVVAA